MIAVSDKNQRTDKNRCYVQNKCFIIFDRLLSRGRNVSIFKYYLPSVRHRWCVTYAGDEANARDGAQRAKQRDRPPVEQVSQEVREHAAEPGRRARQRRHGPPEPGLRDLAHVRQDGRLAEPDAQAHQHRGRVQHGGRVGPVQEYPSEDAGHVREYHAPFTAVPLLQETGHEAPGRMEYEQYTPYTQAVQYGFFHRTCVVVLFIRFDTDLERHKFFLYVFVETVYFQSTF